MKYVDVKNLLPNANFIYIDVDEDEISAVESAHYVTEFDGKKVLGTVMAIEELKDKELKEGSVRF